LQRASKEFNTIFSVARKRFTEVFRSGGKDKQIAPFNSVRNSIQQSNDARYKELRWVADNDPVKEQAVERKPLLEYWFILNEKIIQAKKEAEKAKKEAQQSRRKGRR
jgi:hypothetical protein